MTYDEEDIDLNDFYKTNPGDKIRGLFDSNIKIFEIYCSKLYGKQMRTEDFGKNESTEKILILINKISKDFEEFTNYYSITTKKQEQIEIWKNILYTMRFLFQYRIIIISEVIIKYIINIFHKNYIINFEEYLLHNDFSDIINTFIILSFILFDSNAKNIEKIKNIFQTNILVYFIFIAFIESKTKENIFNFIKCNITELESAKRLYLM